MENQSIKNIALEKQLLRRKMKAELEQLTVEEYQRLNRKLKKRFFSLEPVQSASSVMIYYSVGKEVETVSLINRLLQGGKTVGLPICTEEMSLKVGRIDSVSQLVKRDFKKFSLMEPDMEAPLLDPSHLDLVVLPGLAFDKKGNRLGHGAGYFDRFLRNIAGHTFKLGLAYDFQVISQLPIESHDLPIDGLLTPENYYGSESCS